MAYRFTQGKGMHIPLRKFGISVFERTRHSIWKEHQNRYIDRGQGNHGCFAPLFSPLVLLLPSQPNCWLRRMLEQVCLAHRGLVFSFLLVRNLHMGHFGTRAMHDKAPLAAHAARMHTTYLPAGPGEGSNKRTSCAIGGPLAH